MAEAYTHAPIDLREQQYKVRDQELAKAITSEENQTGGTDHTLSTHIADDDDYH